MATDMSLNSELKEFLACIACGNVVLRMPIQMQIFTKKKDTFTTGSNPHLSATFCHSCDKANNIRNSNVKNDHSMIVHINRRMVESWYVYTALTRLVGKSIEVNANGDDTIGLINRDEFIQSKTDAFKLTTVQIHPDDPEEAIANMCPYLVTGFF